MAETIPFIDLQAQRARLAEPLEAAVLEVVRSGRWILGPEVEACERELAAFAGAEHCLTVASGTDALALALMAAGLKPGDAVVCPAFTFAATAEVVAWLGATPVFADVDPASFNLDVAGAERAVATARARGLTPRAIIAVDLFGQPADHAEIAELAAAEGLWVLDDAAQAFGASYRGRRLGTRARLTATSFFPAKPLGCYGDGGALLFDDDDLVEPLTSLRVHGQGGDDKYDNVRIGMNGRMDAIQCAVIRQKLTIFEDEIARRQEVAAAYADGLGDVVAVPRAMPDRRSVWAQYTLTLPAGTDRDAFRADLQENGVPTAVYYGRALHHQTAYARYPVAEGGCPVAEDLARRVVSLPMHPYLAAEAQARVIEAVRGALARPRSGTPGAGGR
ncbi:MAG: aminotransferase class I/II-fold pyridoxal phosphate-dependent enzyme [Alphaproteobacteria bacterium]|jgi:dTDP-4-amino-4,6-dideoxygalactose transaminase|nr:aminotransferase class I/II-fold pyridoxal phosphate-dependent enzyme [Alphaproteobacteria bacterium]